MLPIRILKHHTQKHKKFQISCFCYLQHENENWYFFTFIFTSGYANTPKIIKDGLQIVHNKKIFLKITSD